MLARCEHFPTYRRGFWAALYVDQVVHGSSRQQKRRLDVRLHDGAQGIVGGVLFFQVGSPYDLLHGQARKYVVRLGLREVAPRLRFRRRAGFPVRRLARFVNASRRTARRPDLPVRVVVQHPDAAGAIQRRRLGFWVVPALPPGREKEEET